MSKEKSTIEIDLQNLSSLSKEVDKLKKLKTNLLHEVEEIEKKRIPWEREVEKNIEQKESELALKMQERSAELDKREAKIKKDEKLISKRLEESESINQLLKSLEVKQAELAKERKFIDDAISSASEKEHKAKLLIEQYTKKLAELGEEPKEEKKEAPKDKK